MELYVPQDAELAQLIQGATDAANNNQWHLVKTEYLSQMNYRVLSLLIQACGFAKACVHLHEWKINVLDVLSREPFEPHPVLVETDFCVIGLGQELSAHEGVMRGSFGQFFSYIIQTPAAGMDRPLLQPHEAGTDVQLAEPACLYVKKAENGGRQLGLLNMYQQQKAYDVFAVKKPK